MIHNSYDFNQSAQIKGYDDTRRQASDLDRTQQIEIRKMLAENPAGVLMRESGTLVPVKSCSKDGINTCRLSVTLRPGENFRVFFEDKPTIQSPTNWALIERNPNIESKGEEQYPGCIPGAANLHAFSLKVKNGAVSPPGEYPNTYEPFRVKFSEVAKQYGGNGKNDVGEIVRTTTVSIISKV